MSLNKMICSKMYTSLLNKLNFLIFIAFTFSCYTSPFFIILYISMTLCHCLNAFFPIFSFFKKQQCLTHSKLSILSAIELWTSRSTYLPCLIFCYLLGACVSAAPIAQSTGPFMLSMLLFCAEHYQAVGWTFVSKASWVHSVLLFSQTDILNM